MHVCVYIYWNLCHIHTSMPSKSVLYSRVRLFATFPIRSASPQTRAFPQRGLLLHIPAAQWAEIATFRKNAVKKFAQNALFAFCPIPYLALYFTSDGMSTMFYAALVWVGSSLSQPSRWVASQAMHVLAALVNLAMRIFLSITLGTTLNLNSFHTLPTATHLLQ